MNIISTLKTRKHERECILSRYCQKIITFYFEATLCWRHIMPYRTPACPSVSVRHNSQSYQNIWRYDHLDSTARSPRPLVYVDKDVGRQNHSNAIDLHETLNTRWLNVTSAGAIGRHLIYY